MFNDRNKKRIVVDGSHTPEPVENIYSGVVYLKHLKHVTSLGEHNNLELWGSDIGNAYLLANTNEKLFTIAVSVFEELEGFIPVFNKALCGLKSCEKAWVENFHHIIKDNGFMPSNADPCVWMRENKKMKCYGHITTYPSYMLRKHWKHIKIFQCSKNF